MQWLDDRSSEIDRAGQSQDMMALAEQVFPDDFTVLDAKVTKKLATIMANSTVRDTFEFAGAQTVVDERGLGAHVYLFWRKQYTEPDEAKHMLRTIVSRLIHDTQWVEIFVFYYPPDYVAYLESGTMHEPRKGAKAVGSDDWTVVYYGLD